MHRSALKHRFLPILLPLRPFPFLTSAYSFQGYFKSPFSLLCLLNFFLLSPFHPVFFPPFSHISASLRTPSLLEEGLELFRFADFKAREHCDDLVWTIQLPSINCLKYWMSFVNKTGLYLSSLGILSLCYICGSYVKKPSFSNFLFPVLALS